MSHPVMFDAHDPDCLRLRDICLALGASPPDRVDWSEIAELVDASYRLTAPARLVKELDSRA
ncbi:hypothetical protein OO014_09880 [Intrasporangium calvum]|uniref:Uncharacterized protein n=1 Tax=Intrasporangium calvum TaxID=53358 RepID=A0ABT5GH37_9MICO|nr:hypothetical protein [Intrasporangium calvum]MDC5697566.1 hypothetical protein [Intrasporangium calvum]